MEKSLQYYNFSNTKKKVNAEAIREYGFSNNGELKEIKNIEVKPLTAGIYNLVKQLLP